MPRRPIAERIAQLDARRKDLQARLGRQERANDTRRKILLGALVLHRIDAADDPEFSSRLKQWLRRELPGFLTRETDKTLFADLMGPIVTDRPAEAAMPVETGQLLPEHAARF